ncbi:MAG: phage portal protein, partial [Thermoleophilaceae bacterium]
MGLALWGHRRKDHSPPVEERALTSVDLPWMAPPTAAGIAVTPEGALRLVDVLACVRLLAESASILPLKAYRRTEDGREPYTGRLADLLERPSPATCQANLIAQTVASMAMRGNAYWGLFRNGEGVVEQLAILPPDRVAVELMAGEPLYSISGAHGVTTHGADQVLHFKGVSIDGITGLSPLGQAREALGLAAAVEETTSALFANQAAPRGVLTVAAGPGEDESMENLRAGFSARHGGSRNAGRVAVMTGDVGFTAVSLSPGDAELVAQRKLS